MKRKKRFLFVLGLITCLFLGSIGISYSFDEGEPEEIVLIIGEAKSIYFKNPIRVSIANPSIVDVPTANENEIVLIGKSKGRTKLFIWDKMGRTSFRIRVIPEDNEYINQTIQKILKDTGFVSVYTKYLEAEGRILLMGKVRNVDQREKLRNLLGDLYNKVTDLVQIDEAALIEIAVEVLEMSSDAQKSLGLKMPRTLTLTEGDPQAGVDWRHIFRIQPLTRSDSTGAASPFSWTLELLEAEGKVRILSRPRVVCQSGKEAELMVGGEVPIFTTQVASAGGQGTEVEYKEYGIKLTINPTVTEEAKVQLVLNVEISEVGDAETIGDPDAPTAKAYPITKRNVSTQLYLSDGETLAIGGLIKQKTEEDLEKFPWLADVPVLGAFFRHRTTTKGGGTGARGDTELFITLTPKVMCSDLMPTEQERVLAKQEEDFIEMYKDIEVPTALQDYIVQVQRKILTNISYPSVLLNTGWQGNLILKLNLGQTGEVKDVQVVKSSGYKIFDDDAVKLSKMLSYPPFPPEVRLQELDIEVPIVYRGE